MKHNPVPSGYETYEFNMTILENGIPEELLQFMTNIKKANEGTGTTTVAGRIKFLLMILSGE